MTAKKRYNVSTSSSAYRPSKKRPSTLPTHCQHEGCTIKLSIYNMTNYCTIHERLHSDTKNQI